LIAKTRRVAQETGFPVIEINSDQQIGSSLGARLSNSIHSVFQAGFEQVLVIGTDTPAISSGLLQDAAAQISPTQASLGASKDGGAYLIGFHKKQFHKTSFSNLDWESEFVFEGLVDYFLTKGKSIHYTKTLQDIDSVYDLMQFLKQNSATLFAITVQQLINSTPHSVKPFIAAFQKNKGYNLYHYNRPPPFQF